MIRPTPAIVTQLAARRLPRWVLILMGLLYVVPGFLGRDPWRNDELAAFGVMLELAMGRSEWWNPNLLGEPAASAGWLPYWLGAWSIQLFGFLPADLAAKLPFAALLLLTMASTWYGAFHLARLPGAQPVTFAFGGQAHPLDYARATADAALLALVATLGVAMLAHETSVDAARLAWVALAFHASARALSPHTRHPVKTVLLWWLSAFGLAFSGVPGLALWIGLLTLAPWVFNPYLRLTEPLESKTVLFFCGFAGSMLAAGLAWSLGAELHAHAWKLSHWAEAASWQRLGRLLLWFTWPTGLLALWAIWTWRRQWRCAHWLLPVVWASSLLLVTWLDGGRDRTLLMAMPLLAALAAFALPTLRRSVTAWLDWFALLFFTAGATIIWIIWIAMMTGIPPQPAANVAKLAPLFQARFDLFLFVIACMVTLGWLAVMVWRLGRHRPALWKSLVLSASGVTFCWVLLMTLWLPLLNHGMGLAPLAQRVAQLVPAGDCVAVHGLGPAQISGLIYHGRLSVQRLNSPAAERCKRLVVDADDLNTLAQRVNMDDWALMSRLPRLRDNRETWLVFQKAH
ncbi:MAG: hypothetical protein LRY31_03865 [Burkholderiaceae bacterium]|nr:hypothetical protein [Burkholderiaceae bacterium]